MVMGCDRPRTVIDAGSPDRDVEGSASDANHDVELVHDTGDAGDAGEEDPLECGYPSDGYGFIEGRVLEPFLLRNCDGEEIHLSRLWCGQQATIVHLSVAWCSTCEPDSDRLNSEVMQALDGEAIQLVEVLVESMPGVVPTEADCSQWQSSFEPPLTTYVPPNQNMHPALDLLIGADALPLTVVVDSLGIIRVWSAPSIPSNLVERLVEILD